jgi:hypothetical protein
MIGPWDRHPVGSFEWAEAVSDHVQFNYQKLIQDGRPKQLVEVLRQAIENKPHPWEVFPEEANGNPEEWMRLVTGVGWSEIEAEVKRRDPEAWPAFAEKQANWESRNREPGAPVGNQNASRNKTTVSDTDSCSERDNESARGIRRRIQKRANDGDEQAIELMSQLAAGDISVNQAAVAAGMRQEYMRLRKDDAAKAAKAIVERAGLDFAQALALELADLVKTT